MIYMIHIILTHIPQDVFAHRTYSTIALTSLNHKFCSRHGRLSRRQSGGAEASDNRNSPQKGRTSHIFDDWILTFLPMFWLLKYAEILLPGPADWIHRRFSPANHYFWRFTYPTWQWKIMDFLHHLIGISQLPDSCFPTFTNLQLGSTPPASGATCRGRAKRVGLAVSATPNANRKVYTTHFW